MNDEDIIDTVDEWEHQRTELEKARYHRRWDSFDRFTKWFLMCVGIMCLGLFTLEAQETYLKAQEAREHEELCYDQEAENERLRESLYDLTQETKKTLVDLKRTTTELEKEKRWRKSESREIHSLLTERKQLLKSRNRTDHILHEMTRRESSTR